MLYVILNLNMMKSVVKVTGKFASPRWVTACVLLHVMMLIPVYVIITQCSWLRSFMFDVTLSRIKTVAREGR